MYYQLASGVYEYDLTQASSSLIVSNEQNELEFLAIDDEYLIYIVGGVYWLYNLDNKINISLSEFITIDTPFSFVCLNNDKMYLEVINEEGEYNLIAFSLTNNQVVDDVYNIGNEEIINNYSLNDNYIYAELLRDEKVRYVIMDLEEKIIVKELDNPYIILRGID